MTPEQQALMKDMIGQLGGGDLNKGDFLTAGEHTSLAGLEQMAMDRVAPNQQADEALSGIIAGKGNPTDFTDYFNTNVQDPALKDFSTKIMPAISRSFGGSSFFGSERGQADRNASSDLMTGLTASRSKMAFDTQESANNRLLTALGLQPQVQQARSNMAVTELGAKGVERGARDTRINQLLQLLQTKGIENLGAGLPGSTGMLQSFAGGFGQGIGGAMGGSDRRTKRNIQRVGTTPSGVPIYRFQYVGATGSHLGVMADEVDHIPGAVVELQGTKFVDYRKVI
jgi:hypothetical protein